MSDRPFTVDFIPKNGLLSHYDNHITRRLSDMRGQFVDQAAYDAMLVEEDVILYEVYEIERPQVAGEILQGLSVIRPGKVGAEYFMTKGHFHSVLETAEVYYGLAGEGAVSYTHLTLPTTPYV